MQKNKINLATQKGSSTRQENPSPLAGEARWGVRNAGRCQSLNETDPSPQPSPARGEGAKSGLSLRTLRPKRWLPFLTLCATLCAAEAHAEITVKTTSLGHGVEAWYAPSAAVPLVDVLLTFEGAGSASDPEGKAGRASFAAAMLTEGAGTLTGQSFAEALEENAITFTADANSDALTIHIRCLREHAARAGELAALALTQPILAEPDATRIKAQMTSLLSQLEENPNYQAQKTLAARAFKNHPYASLPFGSKTSVATLTPDDIRSYLSTYVTRGNLVIAASGDVDNGILEKIASPTINALRSNDAGAVTITRITPAGGGETLKEVTTLPQTIIAFTGPGIDRSDKRFYAAYLLNHIIGGGSLSSRLGLALRQKSGLAYSVDTDLDIRRGTNLFTGTLATRNATAEQALNELKAELAAIRDRGVTTEECADAKSYVLGHFPLQLDRTTAVSGLLTTMQRYKLGKDYLEKRVSHFSAVTCTDINNVAKELLTPEKLLFALVGGTPTKADKAAAEAAKKPATPTPHSDAR